MPTSRWSSGRWRWTPSTKTSKRWTTARSAHPLQRRHPQRRKRADRSSAAPQVQNPGRVWLMRQRRLHPRPGQLQHDGRDLRHGLHTASRPTTPTTFGPNLTWSAPEGELNIPKFYPVLKTLDQVVPVDYYMPGCPPESHSDCRGDRSGDQGAARRSRTAPARRGDRGGPVDGVR